MYASEFILNTYDGIRKAGDVYSQHSLVKEEVIKLVDRSN